MLVLVAPGQGAQTPGFLNPWLELPGVADRLHWWSAVAGLDLVRYGTEGTADEIRDTAVAQPLLVAAGLVSALSLFPHPADARRGIAAVAGHSVGELTAAAGAGVITAESAMALVRQRGLAMAKAAAVTETGMSAVLGGDPEVVHAKLVELGLTPANVNGAGQIVAAGTMEQLAALSADKPEGARVMPLKVAGAFHTTHMEPAVATLQALLPGVTVRDPRTRYVSNADGRVVHSGAEIARRLVKQVAGPVRWDLCMETFKELGVTAIIEVSPAGTLVGLAKRALPGVRTLALKTPDDLDAAREIVAEHGDESSNPLEHAPTWRLAVAPFKGTVAMEPSVKPGQVLAPGATVAHVGNNRERQAVVAEHGGTVVEWLVEDGDPVAPGQPLLRVHPAAE
ncbi:acyltransferase domain-containing protein [Streptomyces sp. PTM05]|uniref:[acyl-carrier-protein] S-malonyltransferase n=1 Tax=Streptantibioticus parmotrematis TaxID=2873249 RepID=A0ABS7QXJ8_9ACTN|nr:acyltransferase domain-containing protein [Streptantibioticus parmotrematis]